MSEQNENKKDSLFFLAALVILVLFALVGYGLINQGREAQRTSDLSACISHWATQVTKRTLTLAALNNVRSNKTDRIIRDVYRDTARIPRTKRGLAREKRRFKRDLRAYVQASDIYKNAIKTYPPPEAPAAQC